MRGVEGKKFIDGKKIKSDSQLNIYRSTVRQRGIHGVGNGCTQTSDVNCLICASSFRHVTHAILNAIPSWVLQELEMVVLGDDTIANTVLKVNPDSTRLFTT